MYDHVERLWKALSVQGLCSVLAVTPYQNCLLEMTEVRIWKREIWGGEMLIESRASGYKRVTCFNTESLFLVFLPYFFRVLVERLKQKKSSANQIPQVNLRAWGWEWGAEASRRWWHWSWLWKKRKIYSTKKIARERPRGDNSVSRQQKVLLRKKGQFLEVSWPMVVGRNQGRDEFGFSLNCPPDYNLNQPKSWNLCYILTGNHQNMPWGEGQ